MNLEAILETYSLEEILEYNDIDAITALEFMLKHRFVTLPEIKPLDYEDD